MSEQKQDSSIGGLRFTVHYGDKLVKTVELAQDCIFIGRLLTSHLPVEDFKVSRMHAVIEVRGGNEVILNDLDSSNGTFVNGQEEKVCVLKSGDVVEVGDTKIKVEFLTGEFVANKPAVVYHSGISKGLAGQQIGVNTVLLDSAASDFVPKDMFDDEIDNVLSQFEVAKKSGSGPEIKGATAATVAPIKATQKDKEITQDRDMPVAGKKDPQATRTTVATPSPVQRLPRTMGTAFEVKVQWGEEILDVLHLSEPTEITIGTDKKNSYIIPPLQNIPPSVPVVSPIDARKGGGFILGYTEKMEGWVYTGDKLNSLEELKKSPRIQKVQLADTSLYLYPLSPSDKGIVSIENLAFCFQTVRYFPPYKSPANKKNRLPFFILFFLYLILAFFLAKFPVSEVESTLAMQVEESQKAAEVIYTREQAKGLLEKLVARQVDTGSPFGDVRGKAPTGKSEKGNMRDKGVAGAEGAKSRARGTGTTTRTSREGGQGLAKALDALKADDITRILGKSGFSGPGGGTATADTGKFATTPRIFANLGSSLRGTEGTGSGDGGGGKAFGGAESSDIGGLGTKGRGGGSGGYGTVKLGRKLDMLVEYADEGDIETRGSLDKALVKRVVERNLRQIQFCYDTKLQLNPGGKTSGRVVVKWRIAPNGRVTTTNVTSSSVNDGQLESCVMDRIKTWIFPEPKGGGSVMVEYPFVFKPSGV